MRDRATVLRLFLGLTLGGLLLAASPLGDASPAAAMGTGFGGFGHFGGFGGGFGGGRGGMGGMGPHGGMGRGMGGGAGMGMHRGGALAPRGGKAIAAPPGRTGRGMGGGGDGGGYSGGHRGPIIPGGGVPIVPGSNPPPQQAGGGGSGGGNAANAGGGGGGGGGNMPPRGERRFVPDEVVTEFTASATPEAIEQIARRHNITLLETQPLPLLGSTFYRWRIVGRRPVGDLIGAIEDERLVRNVQPNYLFVLQEEAAKDVAKDADKDADKGADKPTPEAQNQNADHDVQYVLGKLQVEEAQHVATGKSVTVALIDSEIDTANPNLAGAVVKNYDALGGEATPHTHGTAMAGAIAAHGKLLGIAPGVQIIAARAFDDSPREAKGTSFAIYKSLQWAADNGARVVNMSFAGPADPALHRMLEAAAGKGILLIAAAGNAGPSSPPLYPAADPSVVAVTATDANDGLFAMANRGPYVVVAAPGVDVVALAPGGALQLTTGTSVATAHVSGLAALLLECKPSLKPADIRGILAHTAKPLGGGAGLVNAYRAVTEVSGAPLAKDGGEKHGGEEAKQ